MPTSLEPPTTGLSPDEDTLERVSRVVRTERAALAALARHEGLTSEEAVDCVQDALCTLLDLVQEQGLGPTADLAPLLFTIVRNAARNRRRRHFRAKPHLDWGENEPVDEGLALAEDLLSRAEETVRLHACIAELCEIQHAVVTLRLLEERPGEDVAELLGVSNNHVAVLLYRAKSALRACMTSP